jgi:hypothetical protein
MYKSCLYIEAIIQLLHTLPICMVVVSVQGMHKYSGTITGWSSNLCKIWGFHGGDYEECHLLGCGTM